MERGSYAGRSGAQFPDPRVAVQHNRLSKRMYKKPEYCAACHKQFIDAAGQPRRLGAAAEPVRQLGGEPLEPQGRRARDGGVPRVPHAAGPSHDPAAGDSMDYNRSPDDQQAPQPPLPGRE